jgi:hypothetical protein
MFNIPKFTDIFGDVKITEEMKVSHKPSKPIKVEESVQETPELFYEGNFSDSEIEGLVNVLDHANLFVEADEEGKIKKTALIQTSKEILDLMTDGRWSKFSKEEKADFLRNYIWDGTKFVPTKKGRVKAALSGIASGVKKALMPKALAKNLATDAVFEAIVKGLKNKKITVDIVKKAIKTAPRGAALSIIILSVIEASIKATTTSPKNPEKDFVKDFDNSVSTIKSKIKGFADKLKSLFSKN